MCGKHLSCGEFDSGDTSVKKTLVSDRELNNNRKSHADQNVKLNMSLLKETCFTHRVLFRSSMHCTKFVIFGTSWLEYDVSSVVQLERRSGTGRRSRRSMKGGSDISLPRALWPRLVEWPERGKLRKLGAEKDYRLRWFLRHPGLGPDP